MEAGRVERTRYQTDFRCLFGREGIFGFLVRFGGVPTNVGSGGGVQPLARGRLAEIRDDLSLRLEGLREPVTRGRMAYQDGKSPGSGGNSDPG